MSIQRAEQELTKLHQDVGGLELRLAAARERAMKLEHYIEMSREFGASASESTHALHNSTNETRQRVPQGGVSGQAVKECVAILRERNQRIKTPELFSLLIKAGIHLGGRNPVASLSGYLSRTPGLIADRSLGWSLEEWARPAQTAAATPETPAPMQTDSGSLLDQAAE